jgi:hypothetical protein
LAALPGRTGGGARRQSTETKHATKTTEFYAYVATVIGVLIAGLVIEGEGGPDILNASNVWLYVSLLTFGYMVSRGIAKSGSREPYWQDEGNDR